MRLSIDRRAYKGPRIGDFIADSFSSRKHLKLVEKVNVISWTPGTRKRKEKKSRGQQERKKQNELNRFCPAPIIRIRDSMKPVLAIQSRSGLKATKSAPKIVRNLEMPEKLSRSANAVRHSISRMQQIRPHRFVVVQKISRETKTRHSQVLKSCLEYKAQSSAPAGLPSRRSRRRKEIVGARRRTLSPSNSRRRRELHERLRSSLASSSKKDGSSHLLSVRSQRTSIVSPRSLESPRMSVSSNSPRSVVSSSFISPRSCIDSPRNLRSAPLLPSRVYTRLLSRKS